MKQTSLIALVLALGISAGALISPLLAQQQIATSQQSSCFIGENSNAACSGDWIYFAGNTSAIDSGAWVVGINSETREIWYKDGRRLTMVEERD